MGCEKCLQGIKHTDKDCFYKNMGPKHTPTPWKQMRQDSSRSDGLIILGPDGKGVANTWSDDREECLANAAFIVRAVNAHEELVETLKAVDDLMVDLVRTVDKDHFYHDRIVEVSAIICRAIAKAEGKC